MKEFDDLYITDLISADVLWKVQEAFSSLTGMAAMTTDAFGVPVTEGSNVTHYCMDLIRSSEIGKAKCENCDRRGALEALETGKSTTYICHAGLTDFAAPIMINGKMIGTFIGGQILTKYPEDEEIEEVAESCEIDADLLKKAIVNVPVHRRQKIDDAVKALASIAKVLSDMAYTNYLSLQANEEVNHASQLKTDFLANMSHEIRTPMNAVIGMAEMALREELPPKARECLQQIKSSGHALLTIINDILDFSKIEAGKMDIIPEEYDSVGLFNEVANTLKYKIIDKPLKLTVDTADTLPGKLYGDSQRIRQILINLANNAIKFTNQGSVSIMVDYEKLDDGNIMLIVEVKDTGIGIKKADLNKIFESFQQVDSKRNRNIEGTGLGLAISKQLVSAMGGNLYAESVYGEGSTFSFGIPQKVTDWTPTTALNEQEYNVTAVDDGAFDFAFTAPEAKVLIVDDNEVNLMVAEGLIEPLKMQVTGATSGKEALEIIDKEHFDLIFMDHMMPEMDGVEVTRVIRRMYPDYNDVPIIALTANAVSGTKEMFLSEGMNDFVPKPIDLKVMTNAIRTWLPVEMIVEGSVPVEDMSPNAPSGKIKIADLDTSAAIGLLGSETLFYKVLKEYYKNIEKKAAAIMDHFDNKRWPEYTIEVHALKSSSKQIGAMELSDMAAGLEMAGNARDTEYIKANTPTMLTKYLSYRDLLDEYCREVATSARKRPYDRDELLGLLSRLFTASEDLDMDGMEENMNEICRYEWPDEIKDAMQELKDAVESVDVDSCGRIVHKIVAEIG